MATLMASPIVTPTFFSSSNNIKSTIFALSSSVIPHPKGSNFHFSTLVPQVDLGPFCSWNGLRHLSISVAQKSLKVGRKGKYKGKVVYASLFAVRAPEALVIGLVALLVFGPKGLAEGARNLGRTLREFQPTFRELQEVSKEFKSNLEREIGLDEISSSIQDTYKPRITNPTTLTPSPNVDAEDSKDVIDTNGVSPQNNAYTSEEYLKITEEQLKAATAQQQAHTPFQGETQLEPETEPLGPVQEGATEIPSLESPKSEA